MRLSRLQELTDLCVCAQSFIAQGKVLVDGQPVTKAGTKLADDPSKPGQVVLTAEVPRYVSRAGLKLEAALEAFPDLAHAVARGAVALDSGLSTGGFSDCLRQYGASRVYGVDVGYGQVAEKVRRDEGVIIMERTNLRYLMQGVDEPCDVATIDLSFIGVRKCMPAICAALKGVPASEGGDGSSAGEEAAEAAEAAHLAVLIKPQFEAGKARLGKGGVVRDEATRQEIMREVAASVEVFGFELRGVVDSPVAGRKEGNVEFLAHFLRTRRPSEEAQKEIDEAVEAAKIHAAVESARAAGQGGGRQARR